MFNTTQLLVCAGIEQTANAEKQLSCPDTVNSISKMEEALQEENVEPQSWLMDNLVKPYKCCPNDEAGKREKIQCFLPSMPNLDSTEVNRIGDKQ